MANFTINMPEGTTIYRCSKDCNIKGHWFGYDPEDLKGYGYIMNTFQTTKPLKLINLMSGAFHIDYMDKLNLLYTGTNFDGIDDRKFLALLPLGLPNTRLQHKIIKSLIRKENDKNNSDVRSIVNNSDENSIDIDLNIEKLIGTYYNTSRFSIQQIDEYLITAIREIYNTNFDGFTTPLRWYNTFNKGHMHREIYLFDLNSVKLLSSISLLTGGSNNKPLHPNIIAFNKINNLEEAMKKQTDKIRKVFYENPIFANHDNNISINIKNKEINTLKTDMNFDKHRFNKNTEA